eukprot:scaffold1963_cov242-Pinguiococcus_pyrenoidosus.AAC.10
MSRPLLTMLGKRFSSPSALLRSPRAPRESQGRLSSLIRAPAGRLQLASSDHCKARESVRRTHVLTWVRVALLHVPLVQIFDVRDRVESAVGSKEEGILVQQGFAHDPPAMILGLEVRIREAEEQAAHLALPEEVGQVAHRIAADDADVLVLHASSILMPEGGDAQPHVLGDLGPDLHRQDHLLREQLGERHAEASKSAAHVQHRDHLGRSQGISVISPNMPFAPFRASSFSGARRCEHGLARPELHTQKHDAA